MNFLSHYYLDRIENKPYHNFGLILPDLMSMYKRKWKITDKALKYNLNQVEAQLVTGVIKHNKLDSFFHQSDYFIKYTHIIKDIIVKNNIKYHKNRLHFISHILLELLIDRIIIIKDKNVLREFYNDLDQIDWHVLENFFMKIELKTDIGFHGYIIKFIRRKYLYKYLNSHRIIFIMNRILQKVSLPPISDQKKTLKKSIIEIEKELVNSYFEISNLKSSMVINNYFKAL